METERWESMPNIGQTITLKSGNRYTIKRIIKDINKRYTVILEGQERKALLVMKVELSKEE